MWACAKQLNSNGTRDGRVVGSGCANRRMSRSLSTSLRLVADEERRCGHAGRKQIVHMFVVERSRHDRKNGVVIFGRFSSYCS